MSRWVKYPLQAEGALAEGVTPTWLGSADGGGDRLHMIFVFKLWVKNENLMLLMIEQQNIADVFSR